MNNKGFTLTELLAVIIVLAIIVSIAASSFLSIKRDIEDNQLTNILTNIESKAKTFAFENATSKITYVTIDELIKGGYIIADDSDGFIYDPRDNSKKLNCLMYKIEYKDGEYIVTLENEDEIESKDLDFSCEYFEAKEDDIKIKCDGKECENWLGTLNELNLEINRTEINEHLNTATNVKLTWYSDHGYYMNTESLENGKKITFEMPTDVLDAYFYVTLEYTHEEKDYQFVTDSRIRVDKAAPIVTSKKISTDETQELEIKVSDVGSGLKSYKLGDEDCTFNENDTLPSSISVTTTGIQYLCAIDNVGNKYKSEMDIGKITIIYDNPQFEDETKLFDKNDPNIPLSIPQKNGYTFDGWYDELGNKITSSKDVSSKDITENITLTAKYNFNDRSINLIKYNEDNMNTVGKSHIVFVLDDSGSMAGRGLDALQNAVKVLMDNTDYVPGTIFSVVIFSSSAHTAGEYLEDKNDVIDIVNDMNASGGTSFSSGLSEAINVIKGAPEEFNKENSFVIFLSDGSSNDGTTEADTLKSEYINKLYTIGLGDSVNSSFLKNFASENDEGEKLYYESSVGSEELTEVLKDITEDIAEIIPTYSVNGLISTPGIVVDIDKPFTIINPKTEEIYFETTEYNDIIKFLNDTKDSIDLTKIDSYLKLDGNFSDVQIIYYYNN